MFHQVSTKISLFCLTFIVWIMIPKISLGITNINWNNYQPSSDLATTHKTDTSPNPKSSDNHCQPKSDEPIYLAQSVICQRELGPNILLRRLSYPNGSCVDEIVNTRTGNVLQRNPAPCSRNC